MENYIMYPRKKQITKPGRLELLRKRFTYENVIRFLSVREKRNMLIFWTLIAFLLILLTNLFFELRFVQKSYKSTICSNCGLRQEVYTDVLSGFDCKRCGSELGYAMKCSVCQLEFAYIAVPVPDSLSDKDKLKFKIDSMRCPNCDSVNTSRMPAKKNLPLEKIDK